MSDNSENRLIIGADYFTAIVDEIDKASSSIYIMMFDWRWYESDFTLPISLINQALVRAKRRGVSVFALTNYSGIVVRLLSLGIQAKEWTGSRLMHAKALAIDRKVFISGSHNFTANAMGENVEISTLQNDEAICSQFITYFETLWRS